jgi:hypothetical protein
MKALLISTTLASLASALAAPVFAAELPAKPLNTVAAPTYSWTGFYAGCGG